MSIQKHSGNPTVLDEKHIYDQKEDVIHVDDVSGAPMDTAVSEALYNRHTSLVLLC